MKSLQDKEVWAGGVNGGEGTGKGRFVCIDFPHPESSYLSGDKTVFCSGTWRAPFTGKV